MKTQNMLRSAFGVAAIAVLLLTASCDAANPSALVGRWVAVSGEDIDKSISLELLSDGTGVLTQKPQGVAITWKTEKDRFYLTAFGQAQAVSYKLQGSVLTFTEDNGEVSKYAKCKNDCKEAAKEYAEAEMAENLNYNANGSKCYNNEPENCAKYGRLYDWETAMKACPKGWHLPSNDDWDILTAAVGGNETAGKYLKATSGWNDYEGKSGNGFDAFGFAALPGGDGDRYVGNYGNWWSASVGAASSALTRFMSYRDEVGRHDRRFFESYSVRCLQD